VPRALYFCVGHVELPPKLLPSQPQNFTRSRVHPFTATHVHVASQPAGPAHISFFPQSFVVLHAFP
jgi:hypothetical protein